MKILVIHASAGAGHTKAAEALYQGIKESAQYEVALINSLNYTSPAYKKSYQDTYTFMVTKLPWAWGFFCWLTDIPFLRGLVRFSRRVFNSIVAKALEEYFKKEKFDWIFSTHFLANEVSAALKRKNLVHAKIVSVVTDFDVHSIWLAEGIDFYTVATVWTREKLRKLGVPNDKIINSGIPTDKKFSAYKDIAALKNKLRIKSDVFTVLMATGSFGIGPIAEIVEALKGFQVLVVCGHNKNLYERLSSRATDLAHIYGLVNNMDELMAVADVMITKPGGLSVSEALVNHLPLIFFSPIPGQETNNIKVLKEYGVGFNQPDIRAMVEEIKKISQSADYLEKAKEKVLQIARPDAVKEIVNLIP